LHLEDLGWDASFAEAFEPYANDNLIPARVAARHHGPCELLCERGRLGGLPAGHLGDDGLPAVGDWVAVRPLEGERKAVIEAVLPRRSAFARKEAWRRSVAQVVAANVDTVFAVTALFAFLAPEFMVWGEVIGGCVGGFASSYVSNWINRVPQAANLTTSEAFKRAAAESQGALLFAFADDWGRHASAYAGIDGPGTINDAIGTPNFDRVAREGVLFRRAFVSSR